MAGPCLIKYKDKWYDRSEFAKHLIDEGGLTDVISELKPRKPISAEESSNFANLTEDKDGNFVFFHKGGNDYETIKKSTGGTLATSKEEAAALGRAGGAAMYYTGPEGGESMVKGSSKYAVKVPKDKVYDFNTDPENLFDKAEKIFKEEHPNIAFSKNDQLAQITKLAGERGYDMVVAEWDGKTRAQTTTEFKPNDVELKEGDIIKKPFKEDYVSNKDRGYESIIPETKDQKLKEVYDAINDERNKQNKYDNLYHLRENYVKKDQAEITKMIDESDISQELKDKYKEAVEFKEEKRRSEPPAKFVGKSVKVENAPNGHHLNIGLVEGRTDKLMSAEDVLSKLPKDIKVISHSEIQGTEPSISVETSRPLTSSEMGKFLEDTKQQAIAQLSNGRGILYDTKRGTSEGWGEFNPELFFKQDGKPLKEAEVVEVKKTSEVDYNGKTYFKNEKGNWVNSSTGNEIKGLGPKGKELINNLEKTLHPETPIHKEAISDVKEIETLGKIQGGTVSWEKSVDDAMKTMKSEAKPNESIADVAERKIDDWSSRIEKEISETGKSTFNPTEEDLATMSYHRTNLLDQLKSLEKDAMSTDKVTQENALKKAAELNQKILDVDYVLYESGKVAGRSFYIRQMIARMDSEGGMVIRRMDIIRSQGGEPLTKEQEVQLAKIQAEERELSKDYDKMPTYSQEDFDAELKRRLKKKVIENKSERINKKLTESGKELADKIRTAKLSKGGLRTDLSLGVYDAAIEAIATLVENGAKLGDAIKNVLKMSEYKDINENDLIKSLLGGIDKKDILDNIKSESKDSLSKVSVAKGDISKLVDTYIEEGLRGRELFDQMNTDLREIYPNITDQQVRDAFLKTGEFKLESKNIIDATKAEAKAELNSIAKLESQLENIKENKVKEKNPIKRRKLTEEENRLRNKINSELKNKGIEIERSSSKEVEVKKELAKRFNENVDSILETIDKEIESGDLSGEDIAHLNKVKSDIESTKVNEKTSEKIDNAVERGIKKLDEAKVDVAGNDNILNKIAETNVENRSDSVNNHQDVLLSRYKTNLERKIKSSEDKINNGEFEEKPRTQRLKTDTEAIKLEMKARAIDTKYRRMRDIAAQKNMKWWEKGLSLGQSFLVNELIGGLSTSANVVASGLAKQPLNTLTESTFGLAAHTLFPELSKRAGSEGKISSLKEKQRYRAHYAKLGPEGMKKIWAKTEKNLKTAEDNYNSNPTDKNKEKLRNALVANQSNFIYDWIGSDAWKDSSDVFLKGASTLEEMTGKGEKVGWKKMTGLEKTEMLMGAMGASHGYFKNFSARAEFAASFVSRLEQKSKLGVDISDPNVIIETIDESLVNFMRGKYQEDNYATSAMKSIGQALENPKNPKWEKYGKVASSLFKAKYPIVRTGVNIGREAVQEYLLGSMFGSAIHGKAVVKGIFSGVKNSEPIKESITKEIKKLPSDKVDLIFRCYRKGGLGLVMAGLAAMGYIRFGGFTADKDRKRKEGELAQGELEVFGHNLGHEGSKPLSHLSFTYPALIIANNNRIMAKEGEDMDKIQKSVTSNMSSALRTIPVFNEGMSPLYSPSVPYGRAAADISKLYDTDYEGNLIERDKSTIKNRFLQNVGLRKMTPIKEGKEEDTSSGQRIIR